MYLVGAPHPHKADGLVLLERLIGQNERLVTSSEVLQEILHRYRAINRPDAIQPAFDALLAVVDEVYAIDILDVEHARDVLLARWSLSARDALHVAVMQRHDIHEVLTFDAAFDTVQGITRVR